MKKYIEFRSNNYHLYSFFFSLLFTFISFYFGLFAESLLSRVYHFSFFFILLFMTIFLLLYFGACKSCRAILRVYGDKVELIHPYWDNLKTEITRGEIVKITRVRKGLANYIVFSLNNYKDRAEKYARSSFSKIKPTLLSSIFFYFLFWGKFKFKDLLEGSYATRVDLHKLIYRKNKKSVGGHVIIPELSYIKYPLFNGLMPWKAKNEELYQAIRKIK